MAGLLGTLRGQVRLDIRQAVAAYAALRAQNARTVYALRGTGDAMVASGKVMTAAGVGLIYLFSRMVLAAGDFERKMDFFGAVTDTNSKKMAKLSDYTLQLAKDTIYSANEIADGIIELGKAGVSAEQIMHGIGDAMANLGAAGDIPLAESGQIITSTIQQFDLAARDAVKVTDVLAGAANASIADITDIGVSLKYVGGVANAAGLTFEDTATAISLLAKAGIRGSTAGTSLRQMIVSLPGATDPARKALSELGILLDDGTNLFFTQEGVLKPLSKVYQILQDHTRGLTQQQKLMYLRTIFNNRALSAASILTREGAKGFREMNREMLKTTAADVASKRLDNLSGDIEILRGNIETLVIEQGGPFQETAREWVQALTKLVQAFSDLDPKTQKMIVQSIAISGAVLVAMGAFNLILGTIFKFVAHVIKLAAGLKFLGGIIRIVGVNARWAAAFLIRGLLAALAPIGGTLGIIVVAALAFIAAWILAYKKIEPFRKAVNAWYGGIWKALKATGKFLALLATDPAAAWQQMKTWPGKIAGWFVGAWERIKSAMPGILDSIASQGRGLIDKISGWFQGLPGRVLPILQDFVTKVTSYFTLDNIASVLGTVIGTAVSLFIQLRVRMLQIALQMLNQLMSLWSRLPRIAGFIFGWLLGRIVQLMIKLNLKVAGLVMKLVTGIFRWLSKLPGRVASFFASMVARALTHMIRFATSMPAKALAVATGIVNALKDLPATVGRLASSAVTFFQNNWRKLPGLAWRFAAGAADRIWDALHNLPSLVWDILDEVIATFKNMVSTGYNAVKDFAGGLWDGFKAGLGINSPSFIEKHMFQMNRTVDQETKNLQRKVIAVQTLGKKMAKTPLTIGDMSATSGADKIRRLASTHMMNQNRARTLLAASGKRGDRRAGANTRRPNGARMVRGELDLTPNGKAFIRGVAEDVYFDNDSYSVTMDRMDY